MTQDQLAGKGNRELRGMVAALKKQRGEKGAAEVWKRWTNQQCIDYLLPADAPAMPEEYQQNDDAVLPIEQPASLSSSDEEQEVFSDIAFSAGNSGNSGNSTTDASYNSNLQDSDPLPSCYQEVVTVVTDGTSTGSVDGVAALHLDDLRKSGLNNETILAAGIKSIRPCDIANQIGYDVPEVMSAYSIPFDENFSRIKAFYAPDAPTTQKRKLPKYYQKKGTGNRLYIPPALSCKVLMGKEPLYMTEGEKKTLCANQNGFLCIGITGLWNWKRPGTDELIADFDRINLKGRKIILVPDSDYTDPKKNLINAVDRLTTALQLKGAEVWVLQLPHSENRKTGFDDFIVEYGAEAFKNLPSVLMDISPCFRVEHGELRHYPIKEEPLSKVHSRNRIHLLIRIKYELHRRFSDIVGLRITTRSRG
jgi:hypothetical protein